MKYSTRSVLAIGLFISALRCAGQQSERPPATPLVVHDPYFSIWSATNKLTDSPTVHWTGHPEPLVSLVRIDGKTFRIMGSNPSTLPAMEQVEAHLSFTHTRYSFRGAGVQIDLSFFTPSFLNDLEVLSRPVTYLTWTAHAIDGGSHSISLLLVAPPDLATSYPNQPVTFSRHQTATETVISVGTTAQAVLNRSGDDLKIDWGYFHIALPNEMHGSASIAADAEPRFVQSGLLAAVDEMESTPNSRHDVPRLAVAIPLGNVSETKVSRHVLLSYTEDFAIQFLRTNLRPYWQRNGMSVSTMFDTAETEMVELEKRGNAMDAELERDLTKSAGEKYMRLCILAYRQSIAAHKLVADRNGDAMLFAKENFSNGDISTVDVMYPSAPIFLFFNPQLLEAQVLPVLEYSAMTSRWHFPFAPHDLGQYPLANGQDYGGGEKTEENQMPVEESGNLIILVDALTRAEGNTDLARRYWPQLTQWAEYLKLHGLDPENQLTTDDFAGHVAHNANLSIKAIDALAAYANLAELLHHESEASSYKTTAQQFAQRWVSMAAEGDHYKLAFNSPDTWSQKYNLVWDKILGFNLFPEKVRATETAYYLTKLNNYGLPLDSRADYTKLDWELWTATLADKPSDFQAMIEPIYRWTNETTSRVPMTDWYDTKTGKQVGFQARSVVGGIFMKALSDQPLAEKWRAKVHAPTAAE
jgi:hypothetical protein